MSVTSELIAKGKLRARRRNRAVLSEIGVIPSGTTLTASCRTNSQRGSTDNNKPSYPPVEAIQRALQVLRVVNHFRIATVNDIYSETKIPKPSIVRILETLIVEEYVVRDNLCGGYRVTARAAELWSGYNGISMIIDAARPLAIALTQRTQWPAGIGVLDDNAIAVQFSTAALCPKANAMALGWRLDLFFTAMGRAYLAFCSESERERIFKYRLEHGISTRDDESRIRAVLPQIRNDRFAARGETPGARTSSIATPVFNGDDLLAIVNVSYQKEAVPQADIHAELVTPLLQLASGVEQELRLRMAGRSN